MATWQDGPEYAPHERPSEFTAPQVSQLDTAPPRPQPSADAPLVRPLFEQRHQVSPLVALVPQADQPRDPHQAFEVASTLMTEHSSAAWGAAHSGLNQPDPGWAPPTGAPAGTRPAGAAVASPPPHVPHPDEVHGPPQHDPHQAFHLSQGQRTGLNYPRPEGHPAAPPAPGTPQWFGPGQQHPAATRRLSIGDVLEGVTFPTVAALLVGGLCVLVSLFGWLSPLAFVTAFLTSGRIGYRRQWVRYLFLSGAAALGITLVVGVLYSLDDLLVAYDLLCQLSAVVCWLVLVSLIVLVARAQAQGEQPEVPQRNPDPGWG
ncbi:hypothetical protein CGZ93_03680 [Enemella dayhoffiae]|uniref:Uncharacterized protein n=1 Tax=Enemella dayhoffiae TaxID=2016507 RepID=A0A255HA09_9ACTN|nr:hypothetical protein [Enemella dayhoffiae]OYO24499.1 hypothetical protein CGZ93_03680 [Enemella dayhoffiae]